MTNTEIEARQAYKRSMTRLAVEPKHVEGCKVVPTREHLLEHFPKGAVAAEIGVAFGDFTAEIMARTAPARLHLVDVWGSARYREGLRKIEEKFAGEIETGVVEVNRGMSTDVLATFPDAYFDWVHIDTDHSYGTTQKELLLAATKMKPDGRISGHDFTSGNVITPVPYGVIEACNEFCVKQNWRYEYLTLEPHGHFSFSLVRL